MVLCIFEDPDSVSSGNDTMIFEGIQGILALCNTNCRGPYWSKDVRLGGLQSITYAILHAILTPTSPFLNVIRNINVLVSTPPPLPLGALGESPLLGW